jgi:uncharacterized protein YgbK (DUF1537 family)
MSDFFLADDLSGALDAAAAFHHAGRRVRVVLDSATWRNEPGDDVIGITTETRNAADDGAAEAVTAAITRGRAGGGRLLFKKIDSTMRGPVAAEIAALGEVMRGTRILFTPANPRVGRTVRAGILRVNGIPVAETDFARDPLRPVRESDLATLLGAAASRVVIADAETESDLRAAVERVTRDGGPWVAVGSGALAVAVAETRRSVGRGSTELAEVPPARERPAALERAHGFREFGRTAASVTPGPVLMIGGSAHAANRRQAAELARAHGVVCHEIDPSDIGRAVRAAVSTLREGSSVALMLPSVRIPSGVALESITEAARRTIADAGVSRVFATGGETAFALCRALGISSLDFLREIEAGLALARSGGKLLAVKPGGFGDEQTWVRAWTELRAAR